MNNLKNLAVVGGGTAGLVTALVLKTRFPQLEVDVVRSKKIGTIGVGEGSTEHWTAFMDFVGIHYFDLVKECDATFKSGIMFKGWGPNDYLQSISSGFNQTEKKFPYAYAHQIAKGASPKDLLSSHAWDSRVNTWFLGNHDSCPVLQFHFNTDKLNDFLTGVAEHKGINFYDDEITNVAFDEFGGISSIVGEQKQYHYDFYIDSTGFNRILIGKLGAKWQNYTDCLKMKSAIMFQTEMSNENIPMWTTAQAMNHGWMFSIPTYGRTGNGYIFDSDYISSEQAQLEVENLLKKSIDVRKKINFSPGALDTPWIKNCCAVGLSASFVEPLEASSIGTSIQQSFIIADLIVNYDQAVISKYNSTMKGILDNIRDFIVLHYLTKKTNSQFWIDARNVVLPESLQNKLDVWKNKLPTSEDFSDVSSFKLFSELHYILVLHGLELLEPGKVQKEYQYMTDSDTKLRAAEIVDMALNMRCQTISHKTMIEIIRDLKNENYQ